MDRLIIECLKEICNFSYVMEEDRCVEISFHDERDIWEGTLRRNPQRERAAILASKLPHLRRLNLRKCRLGRLPVFFTRDLEFLDISCNDLTYVPGWVYAQTKLSFLSLGSNRLEEIADLSGLPLQTLKLHKNSISRLPKIPSSVTFLNLFLNRFPSIPREVFELPLEFFSFGATDMVEIAGIEKLTALRWLSLVGNHIAELPDGFCDLKNLCGVRLAKNRLRRLPSRIGEMKLEELTLYSNDLDDLPDSFYDLKLSKLNLSSNRLSDPVKERVQQTFGGIHFLEM